MDEHLIEQAFLELFPEKKYTYKGKLAYSGKFSGFNANIRFGFNKLEVRMDKQFKEISEEIRIGLIQNLLIKIFKTKRTAMTTNMDLYSKFLKNVHISLPKEVESPLLLERFNKLNEQFFNGLLDQPSLRWGRYSKTKLGQYEYGSDEISISRFLEYAPDEYLEYVLYHEMLHKKHKFIHKNGRSMYHGKAFKEEEKKYPHARILDKEIPQWLRWKRTPATTSKQTIIQSFLHRFF